MARHVGKHGARHSLWGGVAVFVVIALTGFLLSTNVRVNRTVAATNDTADLVEQGVDEANQLQQDVSDLTKQVANLTDALKADGTDGTVYGPTFEAPRDSGSYVATARVENNPSE